MPFTPEELEAMRLADEEIDREFEAQYVADQVDKEIDKWLDELAVADMMDHRSYRRRKQQKKCSAAYRAEHKDEIAAYQAAYYAEHKDEIAAKMAAYRAEQRESYNAYMREYMREYKRGKRRKKTASALQQTRRPKKKLARPL